MQADMVVFQDRYFAEARVEVLSNPLRGQGKTPRVYEANPSLVAVTPPHTYDSDNVYNTETN